MEKKRSISKKKVDELYGLIHEEIVKARVNIETGLTDAPSKRFVDNVLSKLCYKLPEKAIDLFLIKRNTNH